MRRPLKPFVTEYKGSRRTPQGLIEPGGFDADRPAPKPFDMPSKADQDDSYEAAMRAADALFSNAPRNRSEPDGQSKDAAQPAIESAALDAAWSAERGGRILRVIDEAPSPQFAELEAQHAPRRRGRKLGSKNKPKVAPTVSANPAPSDILEREGPVRVVAPPPQTVAAVPAARQAEALSSADVPPRGVHRFPWVRDRLKPGEDWKRRRLPRICW